ncbi:MAG TPA: TMEM175 family protein [Protaetiibacter sp.]|nr:TMEM175 family protein [Protaetiibacter sp.]
MAATEQAETRGLFGAERASAFIDAVVAIAMTLLILPLMESVSDIGDAGGTTLHWLAEHEQQLVSFVLSFVIIAMFWMFHHRLFVLVEAITSRLMWLLVGWLLTIVWLPVATAITGAMDEGDNLAKIVYVGSMIATACFSLTIRLYLRRHPQLHRNPATALTAGIAADLSTVLLFAIALTVALLVPAIGYYALFLMLLTPLVQRLLLRLIGRPGGA